MKIVFCTLVVCCLASLAFSESATFLINSSADDAMTQIENNVTDTTSAQLKCGYNADGDNRVVGLRFMTSNIYRGSIIDSAGLRTNIESAGTTGSGTSWRIFTDTTPDSPDFSGSNPSVYDRYVNTSSSSSSVIFICTGSLGSTNEFFINWNRDRLPVIQEIVSRETWDEGDPITLLMENNSNHLYFTSYDGDPANAPVLTLRWSNTEFEVLAGQTGEYILGGSGAVIEFTTASTTDGTITVTRNDAVAGGTFSGAGATAPDGSTVTPDASSYDVYWTISNTGLTGFQYSITLDATGIVGVNDPGKVVLLKRSGAGNDWVPLDTTRVGSLYTAAGISSFSDFTFGAEKATNTLPVGLEYYLVE